MIITMFTQRNLFNTRSAVINEGVVSITVMNYNKIECYELQYNKIK